MKAEIITIGNELLEGRVIDTNSAVIARWLSDAGIEVARRITVGDKTGDIISALHEAGKDSSLIVVAGGLGPTIDDVTMEAASEALNAPLVRSSAVENQIREFYNALELQVSKEALKQAYILEGAHILRNPVGTAPGVVFRKGDWLYMFFPGVPRELDALLGEAGQYVLEMKGTKETIAHTSLKTFGTGETQLQKLIPKDILASGNPSLAFLPGRWEVEVRLTAKGSNEEEARNLVKKAADRLYAHIGDYIYGEDDDTLELVVIRKLKENGLTLGIAESCSGGWLSSRLVSIPGSSEVYRGSIIAYTTKIKEKILGMPPQIIARRGTVSAEAAEAMAECAAERLAVDVGLSITGNAGPTAGDPWESVGQVYTAVAFRDRAKPTASVGRKINRPRNDVRYIATSMALDLLRRNL
ncbi:MAG: competence/damage-inducible protein A [bacterium]